MQRGSRREDKTDMDSTSSKDDESDVWHPDSDPEIHLDESEEPDERKVKRISNDHELIQSDPISCPQNQKGNN